MDDVQIDCHPRVWWPGDAEAGRGFGRRPGPRPQSYLAYVQPFLGAYGAYAETRLIEADRLLRVPDAVDDRIVAATLLKALTVCVLADKVHQLKQGVTILVHAAAGGVGRFLCQGAWHLGATIIGTVGSRVKAEIARRNGCKETILYREEDVAKRVRDLTDGAGVDVVYDSVGHDTFDGSMSALGQCGHLIAFGQSSGPIAPIAIGRLAEKSPACRGRCCSITSRPAPIGKQRRRRSSLLWPPARSRGPSPRSYRWRSARPPAAGIARVERIDRLDALVDSAVSSTWPPRS
jgi:NADPH:quinone reductase-like Zn-dependent oxidoreductase